MHIDLTEIKRRELIELTKLASSPKEVETIYNKCIMELETQQNIFIKETQRGNNLNGMIEWNTFIRDRIKIDNIKSFRLLD